jgi:hypothetical protein
MRRFRAPLQGNRHKHKECRINYVPQRYDVGGVGCLQLIVLHIGVQHDLRGHFAALALLLQPVGWRCLGARLTQLLHCIVHLHRGHSFIIVVLHSAAKSESHIRTRKQTEAALAALAALAVQCQCSAPAASVHPAVPTVTAPTRIVDENSVFCGSVAQ